MFPNPDGCVRQSCDGNRQMVRQLRREGIAGVIHCDSTDDLLFRYSTAVTGTPGRLSRRDEDCQ
jgi:hypothetical protein